MRKAHAWPREKRVRKRGDFLEIQARGRKFHSARFVIYALSGESQPPRFGITVSRKVGRAAARNRIKRVLRECFRLSPFALDGLRIVAIAKKNAPGLRLADVQAELYPILSQIDKCSQSA